MATPESTPADSAPSTKTIAFTYAEVTTHSSKEDLYVVIHDKVFDASSFVDEHPLVSPSPLWLSLPLRPLSRSQARHKLTWPWHTQRR